MNYEPIIDDRLPEQFQDSDKFKSFLKAFLDSDLEQAEIDSLTKKWIDTAEGAQLDGIGDIVGIKRLHDQATDDGNFGFDLDATAEGFGDLINETNGGYLGSVTPAYTEPIGDVLYRILINTKILINNSNMSVDSILEILATMFQTSVTYALSTNLSPVYTIGRTLSAFETDLLKIVPQTLGVLNTYYTTP